MKAFIKRVSRQRRPGYRTPSRFRRQLKYKLAKIKSSTASFKQRSDYQR